MQDKCQYLFVVSPPQELANDIHKIRLEFAGKYHCKAALKPPVHITLIPNFWVLPRAEAKLTWLNEWAATLRPFEIRLRNFNTFPNNGVVFIDVEENAALKALHQGLLIVKTMLPSGTFKPIGHFNPHITIGYRDIPPDLYSAAAREYAQKSFQAAFTADSFQLWKHNGQRWETLHNYKMEGRSPEGELFI